MLKPKFQFLKKTFTAQTVANEVIVSLAPHWPLPARILGWASILFGLLGILGVISEWNNQPELRGSLMACFLCIGLGLWVGEWLMQTITFKVVEGQLIFIRVFSFFQWRRQVSTKLVSAVYRTYRTPTEQQSGIWSLEVVLTNGRRWKSLATNEREAYQGQKLLRQALGHPSPEPPIGVSPLGHSPGSIIQW